MRFLPLLWAGLCGDRPVRPHRVVHPHRIPITRTSSKGVNAGFAKAIEDAHRDLLVTLGFSAVSSRHFVPPRPTSPTHYARRRGGYGLRPEIAHANYTTPYLIDLHHPQYTREFQRRVIPDESYALFVLRTAEEKAKGRPLGQDPLFEENSTDF